MLAGKVVAIAGASSYLSSRLIPELIKAGCQVIPLIRSEAALGQWNGLKGIQQAVLIEDFVDLERQLQDRRADIMINCICNYGRRQEPPSELTYANTYLPLKLLEICDRTQVKMFLNIGTALSNTDNPYALTKNCADALLQISKTRETRVVTIRSEIFYGPAERDVTKLTATIIRGVLDGVSSIDLASGRQERDFLHIDDLLSAILTVAGHEVGRDAGYAAYDVATGHLSTVREFAERALFLSGSNSHLNFGALQDRRSFAVELDTSKLRDLGWKPRYDLEGGLSAVLASEKLIRSSR
jgi:nucleoside-diphosphate-sugar epimerase